jgi:putative transposase
MPKACSNDLRERVVGAVLAGASARSAALRFGVAPSSAIKWVARYRERGDVSPASQRGRVRSPLYEHRQWLLDQVTATPGLTLAELRDRLMADRALAVGIAAIWGFFKREGISFKKNAAAVRANQARRRAQASELAAISGSDLG